MDIKQILHHAQIAQKKLTELEMPAEHIYLINKDTDELETSKSTSLIFVSKKFDDKDLYTRAQIADQIQSGPLKLNFYVAGPKHLLTGVSSYSRGKIFNAQKIYGKKPLILDDLEYASQYDLETSKSGPVLINVEP